jgi:transposase-like protein
MRYFQYEDDHCGSIKHHRFPQEIIAHMVWLYFRFSPSFRDVEEVMAVRGVDLSYETVRCWTLKFGQQYANELGVDVLSPETNGTWTRCS